MLAIALAPLRRASTCTRLSKSFRRAISTTLSGRIQRPRLWNPIMENSEPVGSVPAPEPVKEEKLPKLSLADFHAYNRLAEMMNAYHNHFRHVWNVLYKACDTGARPAGMSIRTFLSQGLGLCRSLTTHHMIEESEIFPVLGARMAAFQPNDHLIGQHQQIHEGLEKLEKYLDECRNGERELRLDELKVVMDGFGKVLWAHLDDEVETLGAENMRRYWTKEEIMDMPW